ncbi:MAG: hypothetical protein RLZZ414_249 [Bacteroidota bacterium]|jgi:hypothetical protein
MNIQVGTFGSGEPEYLTASVKIPAGLNFFGIEDIQNELGTAIKLNQINLTKVQIQAINTVSNTGTVWQVVALGFLPDSGLQLKNRDIYTCVSYRDLYNTVFYNLDAANTYFQVNIYSK